MPERLRTAGVFPVDHRINVDPQTEDARRQLREQCAPLGRVAEGIAVTPEKDPDVARA
jgi:hypothetical protein